MIEESLKLLKEITVPFAQTSEHVQGPGGNTSYKKDGNILIKASGFTFTDVTQNTGVVLLNNQLITDKLLTTQNTALKLENTAPDILESIPAGLKPSMEFEFHSLLNDYVLHTHSVYVNVITCAAECSVLLSEIFATYEYSLVPYVTPGFPIAAALLGYDRKNWPGIIFLKNHGIIIHADTSNEVVSMYQYVEDKIKAYLKLLNMPELICDEIDDKCIINRKEIADGNVNFSNITEELNEKILIPDQSIFFRNKLSSNPEDEAAIFVDMKNEQLIIIGTHKFINAAKSMLQAVFFIKNNIKRLNLTADFIPKDKLDEMHGLSTEKYRLSILNK